MISLPSPLADTVRASLETRCSFSWPGTYGHECGKPAVFTFVFPSDSTKNGLFFTGRCEECARIKGGENARVIRAEPFHPVRNDWK